MYAKLFLLSVLFFSCRSSLYKGEALNKILSDFDRHSYFIGLMVKSGAFTSPYVIENRRLCRYYQEKECLTEKTYVKRMKSIIRNNKVVEIDSADLIKFGFLRVNPSNTIAADMEGDTSLILHKYFRKRTSTYRVNETVISTDQWNAIIYALFRKRIFTKTADESGMLYVPDEQFGK